jgi:arylsulfatase A-like enzyme
LIVVDDLGWTGLRCYGSDLHETPNLDQLADQAVRFTDAYSAAPVCTPTRASIMTGRSPARLHMTVWFESSGEPPKWMRRKLVPPVTQGNLPLDEFTLAEALAADGYFTAHVGKWHLGDAAHYPENHGFDLNIGGTFWGCPATFFYPYRGIFGGERELRYVPGLPFGRTNEYLTDRLTDEALDIMRRAKDGPFFLNLCYYTVHTPIEGKPELVRYYQQKIRDGMDHDNAHYAAMHQSLDENVGRVLDQLQTLGIEDNTVVIFTSDNGGFVNNYRGQRVTRNTPLRSGKGSLYEGGIRVPLTVRWPGVTPAGKVCRVPVVSTDLYPTIRDIVGFEDRLPQGVELDGTSLVPLLKRPEAALERDALYFHYPHYYPTTSPVSAVRAGDWKLLEYFEDGHLELYNLADDQGETTDLSEREPERSAELHRRLVQWRESVGAQLPTKNQQS